MIHTENFLQIRSILCVVCILMFASTARADGVIEWNKLACDIAASTNVDTPTANRAIAMMNTAIYEAVNAITKKYPAGRLKLNAPTDASVEAAVAAASRATLSTLFPTKLKEIGAAYERVIATITDKKAAADGARVGENAAAAILAERTEDGFATAESYRPFTTAGVYVPTILPAVSHWPSRKPWLMTSANQFRPGPPPGLKSEMWARDYNEIKSIGAKKGSARTPAQTEIATFWEATGPAIYHGLVLSIVEMPGREVTQNSRLYMAVTQAVDDAMIAVFDAKYHYNFWRPITAIRNGDMDGNDATTRDPSWTPFISTPMHPEYPCAHCIVSGTIGTVLQAELGDAPVPLLSTISPTANSAKRTWTRIEDFIQEVANGRVYDGVHFRNSTSVGTEMGRKIGNLAAAKYLSRPN